VNCLSFLSPVSFGAWRWWTYLKHGQSSSSTSGLIQTISWVSSKLDLNHHQQTNKHCSGFASFEILLLFVVGGGCFVQESHCCSKLLSWLLFLLDVVVFYHLDHWCMLQRFNVYFSCCTLYIYCCCCTTVVICCLVFVIVVGEYSTMKMHQKNAKVQHTHMRWSVGIRSHYQICNILNYENAPKNAKVPHTHMRWSVGIRSHSQSLQVAILNKYSLKQFQNRLKICWNTKYIQKIKGLALWLKSVKDKFKNSYYFNKKFLYCELQREQRVLSHSPDMWHFPPF